MRMFDLSGWFCALVLAIGLSSCTPALPEQAVRERVDLLQRGIDARDAGAIEALLADDFVGNGGMDRDEARRMATALFLRYRDVGARFGPLQIEMRGERHATVHFTAVATGGRGGLLPEDGQIYEVTMGWRMDDGDWRISSAEWTPKL